MKQVEKFVIEHPMECEAPNDQINKESQFSNLKYLILGVLFGIVFVKAEIISWFRIQEMFRLSSFHMYGVIGTAVIVGMISVFFIHFPSGDARVDIDNS
mgnify:CR=1 FL=1